jgi:UDP-N-acetylglucosamine 2-epimerase (non-hydrolysing)
VQVRLIVTGQHPGLELADHGLDSYPATPLDCPGQPDPMVHTDMVRAAMKRWLPMNPPELLIVQGDTSSALGGALAARDVCIRLAHVEAGLRSHDVAQPWPEESNRVKIDLLSDLLFAPTEENAANLRREQVRGAIAVTGNTGIDALAEIVGTLPGRRPRRWLPRRSLNLLVTCHRRENWDGGLERLAVALAELARSRVATTVVLPPNASVTATMSNLFGQSRAIRLVAPLSHPAMIQEMRRADLILSDSGGMQEEAPALGIPLLILRDKTERPEGVACGSSELVGTDPDQLVAAVDRLRRDRRQLAAMAKPAMPFGDGHSAIRIVDHCLAYLDDQEREPKRA